MQAKRILIVEDESITARYIEIKLLEMDCTVLGKYGNGEQAFAAALELQPDLILMDVILDGGMDGIQTAEKILQHLDVPIVYLTASSDEETISRLMKTQPHGFIIKPFDERVLHSAIEIAVSRYKARKELLQAEEMLRTTLESIDGVVFGLNQEGCFTHLHTSRTFFRNFSSENVIGRHFSKVFTQEFSQRLQHAFELLISLQDNQVFEFPMAENGNWKYYSVKLSLRKSKNGSILGVTLVIADITERKSVDEELIQNRERLIEAQDLARLGTFEFHYSDHKSYYNSVFFELLGITDHDAMQSFNENKWMALIHPEDRDRTQQIFYEAIENKRQAFDMQYRILDYTAKIKYIHSIGRIKYAPDMSPMQLLVTIQDISWQKVNEKLRHDIELARKTAEMKQEFFASVSHEIRNPLHGISGLIEMLQKSSLDDQQQQWLKAIQASSESLQHLLNDLLDVSKMEAGKMMITDAPFDLHQLVSLLFRTFETNNTNPEVELKLQIDEAVPAWVVGDGNRLRQILTNLINNALKYTEKGWIALRIKVVENMGLENLYRFEVEDTGLGIAPEEQKKLFKVFSQLQSPVNHLRPGAGLGLSICKQLVELMGGYIAMESQPGQGSFFWFEVGLRNYHLEPEQEIAAPTREEQPQKLDYTILVVEDQKVNRMLLKMMLEEMGCTVMLAANGIEAIEQYEAIGINEHEIFGPLKYDLIIMDQQMPLMDGRTALIELKKRHQDLPPVILLTADESWMQNNLYQQAGFDDFMLKPVQAEQMYASIRQWCMGKPLKIPASASLEMHKESSFNIPVLDPDTLNRMRNTVQNPVAASRALLEEFVAQMDKLYYQSLAAVELNDAQALRKVVMTAKGLSNQIGAAQVYATSLQMEKHLQNQDFQEAALLLPLMAERYIVFRRTFENAFGDQPENSSDVS